MRRILLCPNVGRDKDLSMTAEVAGLLKDCNVDTIVCPLFDEEGLLPDIGGLEISSLEKEQDRADMIIAFGGDGTILRAARAACAGAAAAGSIPVLGINLGAKGFIADIEREDIGLIPRAMNGEYKLDRRMMLDVELQRDGAVIYTDFALNDVVIAGITKVIDLTLFGDGQKITHFSGDGTIIATPTGSTAYSMAAGGPIIEPGAENIVITPICAHVLAAKSFVLAPERRVSVELGHIKTNPAYLSVDGGVYLDLISGDVVKVRKSEKYTLLVRLSDRSFYKKVSEKLGEKF